MGGTPCEAFHVLKKSTTNDTIRACTTRHLTHGSHAARIWGACSKNWPNQDPLGYLLLEERANQGERPSCPVQYLEQDFQNSLNRTRLYRASRSHPFWASTIQLTGKSPARHSSSQRQRCAPFCCAKCVNNPSIAAGDTTTIELNPYHEHWARVGWWLWVSRTDGQVGETRACTWWTGECRRLVDALAEHDLQMIIMSNDVCTTPATLASSSSTLLVTLVCAFCYTFLQSCSFTQQHRIGDGLTTSYHLFYSVATMTWVSCLRWTPTINRPQFNSTIHPCKLALPFFKLLC
jgi:hypothetical protein